MKLHEYKQHIKTINTIIESCLLVILIDLIANGVKHIHVYSMNKPEVAKGIQDNLSEIIRL